ncbi:MAG: thiol reductant ABC exporter subunit CydD [Anaerolineales bacterium]|nr:thiol reductant ABC exporter subunit CydD [Anaerolineales bacterium]
MTPERRLFENNPHAKWFLSLSTGVGLFAAAMFAAQAWYLSRVVDLVFLQHATLATVIPLLSMMAGVLVARFGALWLGDIFAQHAATHLKRALRQRLITHVLALGPAYTQAERSGELVSVTVEGVETLDDYVTQYLPARYLAGLAPALILVLVLILDPWSTLVLIFAGPMLILLLALIGTRAKQLTERRFLEMSWMSAFFLDLLQGIGTLKMFGRSKEQARTIEEISRHYGNTTMEVLATAFQTSLVMEWAATAATAMVAFEISLRLMYGQIPFTPALAVLILTPEFFLPLRQFAMKYHGGATGKAASTRIFAILDTPVATPFGVSKAGSSHAVVTPTAAFSSLTNAMTAVAAPASGALARFDLTIDDVYYAYNHGQRPALRGFSLTIPYGQKVALVGATGAGKSTVANLLLRFIDPDAGTILAGTSSLSAIDPAHWRRNIAWVPQLPHLFHGTVADNLRLARQSATMDEIRAAADAAYATPFIDRLPQGYDTPLGERGARLSGGQLQRLAIARAFLKDAPLLILDEATANLDEASEREIQAALASLMRKRTVIMIAHRLKLAYSADRIVVMEQGRIVEEGDHATLMGREGAYRRLVRSHEGEVVKDKELVEH